MNKYRLCIKDMKRRGRKIVRSHYLILVITCLFAAFVGSEFTDALAIFNIESSDLSAIISIPIALSEGDSNIFGTDNGVFASIVSGFASGTIYEAMVFGISSIIGSQIIGIIIVIAVSLAIAFVAWFFLGNCYSVISRRIFLESRCYKRLSPQSFLFLFGVRRWLNVSTVMLIRYILNSLWYCLFIVGGIVKRYSYFLVPHILAENPNISATDAITLSREMMDGHKLRCFLLELSYLGWFALRIVTIGLSGLLFSNAYQIAVYTELYFELRTLAKENNIKGSELLNDTYLYEKPTSELLKQTYADAVAVLSDKRISSIDNRGRLESFLNIFGITLHRTKEEELDELYEIKEDQAREYEVILAAEQYPQRLFTLPHRSSGSKGETSNYMIKYTITTLVLFFFIFSFIGWVWEVSLHFINDGEFVNRGTMYGPWLPIYGSGGLLIITLLYKLRRSAFIQFFSAVVLCGIVEYFTSYFLELFTGGVKWWDYSGYFINLHGRICAEGLMVFGLGGIAVVYALAPILSRYIDKFNHKLLTIICVILIVIFIADGLYSIQNPNAGEGISYSDSSASVVSME